MEAPIVTELANGEGVVVAEDNFEPESPKVRFALRRADPASPNSKQLPEPGSGLFNVSQRQGSKASLHRKPRGPSVDEMASKAFELDQANHSMASPASQGQFEFEFVRPRAQSDPFPILPSMVYFEDLFAQSALEAASALGLAEAKAQIEVPRTVPEEEGDGATDSEDEDDDDVFVREGALVLINNGNGPTVAMTTTTTIALASNRRRESLYRASVASNTSSMRNSPRSSVLTAHKASILPNSAGLTDLPSAKDTPQPDLSPSLSTATANRLIEDLIRPSDFTRHISDFLLTYNMFMDSMGLLLALSFRFDEATRQEQAREREAVLYVLQRWIEELWYEFESNNLLLEAVVAFAERRLALEPLGGIGNCRTLLAKITTAKEVAQAKLGQRRKESSLYQQGGGGGDEGEFGGEDNDLEAPLPKTLLRQASKRFMKVSKAPLSELAPGFSTQWEINLGTKPWQVLFMSSLFTKLEFARQLTLLESKLFRKVLPMDLIQHSTKQLGTPPESVTGIIQHFNSMSRLVSHSICLFSDLKQRAGVLRRWVEIAKELLKMNNFNGVFEILAGLHSVAVYRLHKTRQYLAARTRNVLEFLEEVTSRKGNYSAYRAMLNAASAPVQPAVPFIGAALADLSFLDMGHGASLVTHSNGDTLINFNKQKRVAQVLGLIKSFQDRRYLFDSVPELQTFLQTSLITPVTDKQVYQLSLQCEAYLSPTDFVADELPDKTNTPPTQHRKQQSRGAAMFLFNKGGS
ncbi:hypothetical protein BASA81_008402 [Batrachochytrium salamandrivorans]|nr:hypothetical protein BASA81_008402 [Batrachochytrium salamandrivorans]